MMEERPLEFRPNPARAVLLGPLLKGVSRSFYITLRVLPVSAFIADAVRLIASIFFRQHAGLAQPVLDVDACDASTQDTL